MIESLLNAVIISKKNTSIKFINTLESILKQTYSPIKIIVVDTNKANSPYSLGLQEDLIDYQEVEYIKLDSNMSYSEIRNYMIEYVDGQYVSFVLNNDTWKTSFAETLINEIDSDDEVMAACANGFLIDERRHKFRKTYLFEEFKDDLSNWLLNSPVKRSAQVMFLRKPVLILGGFDEEFKTLCDSDMLFRLRRNGKIAICVEHLCECRISYDDSEDEFSRFMDHKKLKLKYQEWFYIADKRIIQGYYKEMTNLSNLNYRWLDSLMYMIMFVWTSPIISIGLLLKNFKEFIMYSLKWIKLLSSISIDRVRMKSDIKQILDGSDTNNIVEKNVIIKDQEIEKVETLMFSSNLEFNKMNSLKYAFNKEAKKIIIPDNVVTIKKGMFYGCKQLVCVEIPSTVLEIESYAFQNCINLDEINIQGQSELYKIGNYAFAGCISLKELNLPSGISEMGEFAFADCGLLRELSFTYYNNNIPSKSHIFPSSIEKISHYTFYGCKNLKEIEFGDYSALRIIEDGAFLGCHKLESVIVTSKVKSLGDYVFASCRNIKNIIFLQIDYLQNIGKASFKYCEKLAYFQLPLNIERIKPYTFYACFSLKFIKIPKRVLYIDQYAFRKCPLLSDVTVSSYETMISKTSFDKHTEIRIKDNEDIDNYYI